MKLTRLCGVLTAAGPWLLSAGLVLSACGGQAEQARGPAPVKVDWGGGDGSSNAGEAPDEEKEKAAEPKEPAVKPGAPEETAEDGAIDLDALPPPKAAAPAQARSEPKPEPKPAPKAEESEPEAEEAAAAAPESDSAPVRELQKRRIAKARTAKASKKPGAKKRPAADTAAADAPTYSGGDPCRAASFSVPRVKEACATGGRSAAKRVMKDAINKATANGQTLKCGDCHANQRDYSLKSSAVADLKRWLER